MNIRQARKIVKRNTAIARAFVTLSLDREIDNATCKKLIGNLRHFTRQSTSDKARRRYRAWKSAKSANAR